jgi:mono/diheme cytochrome c family protein
VNRAEHQRPDALEAYEQRGDDQPDVQRLHGPIYREKMEPRDGYQPVPTPFLLAMLALLLWGGWYLGRYSADFNPAALEGPRAFRPRAEAAVAAPETPPDTMLVGGRVFNVCIACHGADGKGVPGKYPPLVDSEWVLGDERIVVRILLQGMRGPVDVLGETYDGEMPGWAQLTDERIAAVLTYIRGSWGNSAESVATDLVASIRAAETRTRAWTASELLDLAKQPPQASADGDDSGTEPAASDEGREEVNGEDSR